MKKSKPPVVADDGVDLLLVLADIHAGSTASVCLPDFQVTDGGQYRINAAQKWLWVQWNECQEWWKGISRRRKFGVVINGDAVEGDHHRSQQVVTQDLGKQCEIATELIAMFATGSAKTWMIHGTDTHVGHSLESGIGFNIGAERDPETGYFFHHHAHIEVHGTLCSFQHHISTTKRKYLEASAMSIEMGNEQLNVARSGQRVPRVMGRAHRHVYGQYSDGDALMVVSPPWKLFDNHTRKVVPGAIPKIGAYALDWRGKPKDSLPDVRVFIRSLPAPVLQKL